MMDKRWTMPLADDQCAKHLQKTLGIHPALCNILVQRGINTFEQARNYFRPQLAHLHSPWLMKDMDVAVAHIQKAFQNNEHILVYGDYDVDGTTAVACMYHFLHSIYKTVNFYIPHRYREGYGLSKQGIDYAHTNGYSLVILLDCGIKSNELIAYAKTLNIDCIICDHHLPGNILPPAVAILNPKQNNCNYPYKELCGCGIGFKLITALCEVLQLPKNHHLQYIDLVATAIAADIVPITNENRTLTFYGLQKINENPCPGIKAIIQLSGLHKKLSIHNVVFVIAPRVNAAGRMDDARKAVELFIEPNEKRAIAYAAMLQNDNTDRKETDTAITEEALQLIAEDTTGVQKKSTVLFQPHWHKGVVGIVASRLIEKHYKPTIVLTQTNEFITGSARSVTGFNIYEAIDACRDLLLNYGGHFYAAGLTMHQNNLPAFIRKFDEVVAERITPAMLQPEITIDATIHFADITPLFYKIIQQMEPFGPSNMRPVFMINEVQDTGYSKIVKENHIRFMLQQKDKTITGIGFNLAHKFHLLKTNKPIDVVCTIDENEWNNTTTLQLKVIDFRLSKKEKSLASL